MALFVAEAGQPYGIGLVLLHPAGLDHRFWDANLESLKSFRIFRPDLPGHGQTPGAFDFDRAVAALHAIVWPEPLHVAGISAGAMVALHWAAQHPEDMTTLLLSGVQVRAPQVYMRLQNRLAPKRYRAPLEAVRRADLRPDLARVVVPTLVVCGSRDRLNLKAAREAHEGIAGSDLRIIPRAGHLWPRRRPDRFAAVVRESAGRGAAP
jgi:3-oxoadipate enol-lactonase